MSTGFPTNLDSSQSVGDAVAAIETRIGVTGSTDPNSVTGALNLIIPQLPHRPGGTTFVHSATGSAAGSNAFSLNTIYAIPFYVPATTTYSHMGIIRTVTVTSGQERLGVYADAGGIPGSLLFDWGFTLPSSGAGNPGFKFITPSPASQLSGGWVWLACAPQGALNTLFATVGTSTGAPTVIGTSAPSTTGMTMGYAGTTTTGQLPVSWGATYTERAVVPLVYLART